MAAMAGYGIEAMAATWADEDEDETDEEVDASELLEYDRSSAGRPSTLSVGDCWDDALGRPAMAMGAGAWTMMGSRAWTATLLATPPSSEAVMADLFARFSLLDRMNGA